MLRSKLKVHLLLVVFLTVCIIPAAVSAVTEDFGPRNETNWTGYIARGSGIVKNDGPICVGFVFVGWPGTSIKYRGWVTFDIGNLPSNACVTVIELHGNCFIPGGGFHTVLAKAMDVYPPNEVAQTIYDAIGDGDWYNTCSDCMKSMGAKSMYLTRSANSDLESAAQGSGFKYFAVGLMEFGENTRPGWWFGWGYNEPILRVTYTVPVQTAPTPTISDDTVCVGEEFCINWNAVPGATVHIVDGGWGGNTNTEWCGSAPNAGTYIFSVRGANSCGSGPSSETVTVTVIDKPVSPASVSVSQGPYCISRSVTVAWDAVPGASSYEVRENAGSWINVGTNRWRFFFPQVPGDRHYSVRALNSCGPGAIRQSPPINVLGQPATPASPVASNVNPCPGQDVIVSWPAVTGATQYLLTEAISGTTLWAGHYTSWSGHFPVGHYELRLSLTNGCELSDPSAPLIIEVKNSLTAPEAPISDQNPAIAGQSFTLSWDPVPGTVIYRLWDNGNILMDSVATPEISMTIHITGEYRFTLTSCDECGCSDMGPELVLVVDEPTFVEDVTGQELPDSYSLRQNYPNPFNPETRIEFSLKRAGDVKLTVYDILGKTVRSLVSEQLSAGYKAVVWDGRDDSGRSVTSGVYLYQLTAGDFSASRKMLLVK